MMSTQPSVRCPARQRGYTMIEILVALFIALFLLAGLFTILQGTRRTSSNQTGLTKLQDEERMAMSLLTDVIQNAGYFDANTYSTAQDAFPVVATVSATGTALAKGQALSGTHTSTSNPADKLLARYSTAGGDGVINCNGAASPAGTPATYVNVFTVNIATSQLQCTFDGGTTAAIALVDDVINLQVWYGVSTQAGTNNVDTYITANNMTAANWLNVTSVRVMLTFNNPLYDSTRPAQQPQYVYFSRVIALQGRTGTTI
jgi:type IV pilus assembly protein PilW